MQAQKEAPQEMQCKDKFLVQSVIANSGATAKDISANMVILSVVCLVIWMTPKARMPKPVVHFYFQFNKEEGHNVEECKLKVAYIAPPQPPSPVREGSEEGSSPRASVSDNGIVNSSEFTGVSFQILIIFLKNI